MNQVAEILEKTNKLFELSNSQLISLEKAKKENCHFVIGGQQIHIFTGPAMLLHKACTLIKVAKEIEVKEKVPCVPIFWLQTEDHDIEEVSGITLPDTTLKLNTDKTNKISLNYLKLPDEIEKTKSSLKDSFNKLDFSEEYFKIVDKHYQSANTYAQAFAGMMLEIFADYGLLVFNPNEEGVKKLCKDIFLKTFNEYGQTERLLRDVSIAGGGGTPPLHVPAALQSQGKAESISHAHQPTVNQQSNLNVGAELSLRPQGGQENQRRMDNVGAGFHPRPNKKTTEQAITSPQVHIRSNSPLFFIHPDAKDKERYRIELDEDGWVCIGNGNILHDAEILKIIEQHPEQISTSALLRPLIQNHLFPDNTFIGGKAELDYLKQIDNLYDFFEIKKSKNIIERISHTEIDESIGAVIKELKLDLKDFSKDENTAKKALLSRYEKVNAAVNFKSKFNKKLAELLEELKAEIISTDKTLTRPFEKTKFNIDKSLDKLIEKYDAAILRKHSDVLNKLSTAQNYLFPENKAQERIIAGVYFLAKYGKSYLNQLIENEV